MSGDWAERLFGSAIEQLPVLGISLAAHQQTLAASARRDHHVELSFGPGVFATSEFGEALCDRVPRDGTTVAVAVDEGVVHREFGRNGFGASACGGRIHYDIRARCRRGGAPTEADRRVVIPTEWSATERPQPGRMAEPIVVPSGRSVIWGIGHWSDLLVANLLALQAEIATPPVTTIDATARIHESAIVEKSVVGGGTVIGPHAVVRDSIIGAGVQIDELTSIASSRVEDESVVQTGALVHGSFVGVSTVVSFHTAIRGSVLFGRSTISAPVVARSVVGADVFLARGVGIGASNLQDTPVHVRVGSRSVSSGIRLLGCAIGSGARVGNGTVLPPGYEVLAGRYLVQRPIAQLADAVPAGVPLVQIGDRFRQLGFEARAS